ncbi:hypothetical protein Syun_022253 [Stephania yunnanensis]|uniref:Zinc finger protein n=1 Tax=Stephania yunnanensis TaxID=152371 RepID=A0AAP0IIL7_9MAGN
MDKSSSCEFCCESRPIVYCKADSARLCLACDSRIHSANALFKRHLRALLCENCGAHPSSIHCLDHRLFACRRCDRKLHSNNNNHHHHTTTTTIMTTYGGCPSAKEFAVLWGFDLNQLIIPGTHTLDISTQISPWKTTHSIVQTTTNLNPKAQGLTMDVQQDSMDRALKYFPSPFYQLENLINSSSGSAIPLHGDPFWHCTSPDQSSELWPQTMQEIGICEEHSCDDGLKIPEVDLTFQNFDELFSGDQVQNRSFFDDIDTASLSKENDASPNKLDHNNAKSTEDILISASDYVQWTFPGNVDDLHSLQQASSCLSLSASMLSAETSFSDYLDSGDLRKFAMKDEPPCISADVESGHSEVRENAMRRYEEKKDRLYEKRICYASRKAGADVRKRVKGRFVKARGLILQKIKDDCREMQKNSSSNYANGTNYDRRNLSPILLELNQQISSAHQAKQTNSEGCDSSQASSVYHPNSSSLPTSVSLSTPSHCAACYEESNATATENRLYLARLTLEYQQLVDRYGLCLAHLEEATKEGEILRQENCTLRIVNKDLTKRLSLLTTQASLHQNHRYLSPAFPSLSIINDFRSLCVGGSGRSSSSQYQSRDTSPIVAAAIADGTQRVFVPGESKEECALEFDVYNQGMFKTELCNKWQETGTCPYGDHCQFAHGIGELRPVIRHPRYKTEVCRMVLSGDSCPYGHRCHFRHALTEQERFWVVN